VKHVSASVLERAVVAADLLLPNEADAAMRRDLRGRLARLDALPGVGPARAVAQLARSLGLSELNLRRALRGGGIGPELAQALGYRKVIRFEKVE
jgi:hypothetical protein